MCGISLRDHRLLWLTQPESLRTMSYYSLPDCFCQKHYTHERQAVEMRAPIKKKQTDALLFFNSSSILVGGFLFFWLFRATSQKVILHLATLPVLQSAQWQINPVGLLWVLCRQMARWCWWGTLVYWRLDRDVQGRSYRVWVIVTLSGLWNAREKCEGWMGQS